MSHFFALLFRSKHIKRWGLMRNTSNENVAEHCFNVSIVAHALCVIANEYFGGELNPERAATLGLFHEAGEVITGDLATPIKYFSPEFRSEFQKIENIANAGLLEKLPEELRTTYTPLVIQEPDEYYKIVKAADKLCAYIKCLEELAVGNTEFSDAASRIKKELDGCQLPEVKFFIDNFLPSFELSLDKLK